MVLLLSQLTSDSFLAEDPPSTMKDAWLLLVEAVSRASRLSSVSSSAFGSAAREESRSWELPEGYTGGRGRGDPTSTDWAVVDGWFVHQRNQESLFQCS